MSSKITLLMTILAVFGICPTGWGQPWDGNGVEGDPYLIYTAEDMQAVGGNPNYWDAHFKLCANIDLSAYTGTSFNIIGNDVNEFRGVFDGNGHIINNFSYTCTDVNCVGLFGYAGLTGDIKNLGLLNANVDAGTGDNVGELVGYNYRGKVSNCYATGVVSGGNYVGGLIGSNSRTVSNCYAMVDVTGYDNVGGLVGVNGSNIINCYSIGEVSGNSDVGGLVGLDNGGTVDTSYWDTEISGQTSSAGGTGKTTTEMQTWTTYIKWGGCETAWRIDDSSDYPKLLWEDAPGLPLLFSEWITGAGTQGEPYLIGSVYEFNFLRVSTCEWDKHFRLIADIDLNEGNGEDYDPIGGSFIYDLPPFTGVFDGNGFEISNFTYDGGDLGKGLFGVVDGESAEIKNLGLRNSVMTGHAKGSGLLIGTLDNGSVTNCYAEGGSVQGWFMLGGLVGINQGTISDCYATCSVEGTDHYDIGGLVGRNYGTITNCFSTGNVVGISFVGGLVGSNADNGIIVESYANGNVSGAQYVGGFMGSNRYLISGCYATGQVQGTDIGNSTGGHIGGLVGSNESDYNFKGFIFYSYATGDVTGEYNVGGLVGNNKRIISNCYSYGSVTGNRDVGGLVGECGSYSQIISSFWDVESSGRSNSCGGIGKTTEEMQTKNTYVDAGWDFVGDTSDGPSDIWSMPGGGGYPVLWWGLSPLPLLPDFSYGTGETGDPYLITTKDELNSIGYNPRLMHAHFKLANDINLAGNKFFNIGNAVYRFKGIFDGNGHKILNFTSDVAYGDGIGLFGYVDAPDAEIKNLQIIDVNINADLNYFVGALVGNLISGTVSRIQVEGGIIIGRCWVGGLVGVNHNGDVNDSHVNCDVFGQSNGALYSSFVGGLIGENYDGTISSCSANGNHNADRHHVGGLVGNNESGSISDCSAVGNNTGWKYYVGGLAGGNSGAILNCFASGSNWGDDNYVGGLVGKNTQGTISNCFSNSDNTSNSKYTGGLVGCSSGVVNNCYAIGTSFGSYYVGGLIGSNDGTSISNCYSACHANGISDKGGFVGYHVSGDYTSCFWDSTINPLLDGIGNTSDPNVIGETTSNMQTESTFTDAGWDFVGEVINGPNDIWDICNGTNYPKLVWSIPAGDFLCPDGVNFLDYAFLAERWLMTDYGDVGGVELTGDGKIDLNDFARFAEYWRVTGCGDCGGADYTGEGDVDLGDLEVFTGVWLVSEYGDCEGAELSGDGKVGIEDLGEFAGNWLEGM